MDDPVTLPQPLNQSISQQETLVKDLLKQIEADILGQQTAFLQRLDDRLHGTGQKTEGPDSQIALLRSIRDRIAVPETKTTKTQFVWNAILQTVALVIGILFGVFSVLSYLISQTANSQSLMANQLALLALCPSSPNSSMTQATCDVVFEQASSPFASLATAVFGPSPTETTSPPQISPTPNSEASRIAIIVGSVIGVGALVSALSSLAIWRQKFR